MDLSGHSYETLESEALHLSREDRSKLATRLIESLDDDDDLDPGPEWNEEIQRRLEEIDNGTAKLIPHDEVMASIRQRLKAAKHRTE